MDKKAVIWKEMFKENTSNGTQLDTCRGESMA